jgi:transcriptional regulator with XRE-family HTH domain
MSHTSDLILKKRTKLGISQGKLCVQLGYSTPQFLSNFERSLCVFPYKKLKQLCKILKIPEKKMLEAIELDWRETFTTEWNEE